MRDRRNCDLFLDRDFQSLRAWRGRHQNGYKRERMSVSFQTGEATREFFELIVLQNSARRLSRRRERLGAR